MHHATKTLSPHSIESEAALIGSVLIDARDLDVLADIVQPDHFFEMKHCWIWQSILALHEEHHGIDNVSVCRVLEERGQLEAVGGTAYITELINATPSFLHAETYAAIVRDAATRRRLVEAAGAIARLALDGSITVSDALGRAEVALSKVSVRGRPASISVQQASKQYYMQIEMRHAEGGNLPGVRTGFDTLDRLLNGFKRGRLYLLAARPGVGKTALMLNMAMAAARSQSALVKIASLEMSVTQLMNRLYAAETGINAQLLERGELTFESWQRVTRAAAVIDRLNMEFDDAPTLTPAKLRASCAATSRYTSLGIVFIDYLQLMRPTTRSDSLYQDTTLISRELKALARELDVPIVALAQLNRAIETRSDKHPRLSDLRDSGSLEQDADVVMFLTRRQDDLNALRDAALLTVAKQRDGQLGEVPLLFHRPTQTFIQARPQEEETTNGESE